MADALTPDDDPGRGGSADGLSPDEDRELRQLTWFGRAGSLSEHSTERLTDLGGRDRRDQVRDARPNPSSPATEETPTLPPLQMDGDRRVMCPNCGSVFASNR